MRLLAMLVLLSSASAAFATAPPAPELDPTAARGALTLLAGAALIVVDRIRRKR